MLSMQWGADLGLLIFFKDKLCYNVCIVIEIPEELCEVGVGELGCVCTGEPGEKGELVGLGCVCTREPGEKGEPVGLGCVCTGEPLWVGVTGKPGRLEPFAEHEDEADGRSGYCRLYISSYSVSSTSRSEKSSSLPSIIGSFGSS